MLEGTTLEGTGLEAMSEFLVVTGMSGAGRSTAAAALEDLGWFVIDNLPAALIMKMVEMVDRPGSEIERVALVIGRGGRQHRARSTSRTCPTCSTSCAPPASGCGCVFLDAADDVLVRRYEGTRRRHPAGGPRRGGVHRRRAQAARAGARAGRPPHRHRRAQLEPVAPRILEAFGDDEAPHMQTSVVSFGYKHGIPLDVDMVFDCRFLPNPFWVEELRPFSGLDAAGARLRPGPARVAGLPGQGGRPADQHPPGLHPGGEVVPDHRHGLHRRAAPLGDPGRGAGGPARARTASPSRSSTGTSTDEPRRTAGRAALGGGHRRRARHRRHAEGRPPLRRRCSPAWSRWPTTAGPAAACASCSTWWRWATCANAWWPWPTRTPPWPCAFERRYDEGELAGHALGNLILAGLIDATGDLVPGVGEAARLLGASGRRPAGHRRAGRAQGRVRPTASGRARWPCQGDRRDRAGLPGAGGRPPPPLAVERIAGGGPGGHRPRLPLHQRAGRRGCAGHCRGPGPVQKPGRLRVQPAPAAPETAGFDVADHLAALARHGVPVDVVALRHHPGHEPSARPDVPVDDVPLTGANTLVHSPGKLALALSGLLA